jgi:hypothetical protein
MASIIQILGLALVSVGAGMFSLPAGIIVAGVALVLIGLGLDND